MEQLAIWNVPHQNTDAPVLRTSSVGNVVPFPERTKNERYVIRKKRTVYPIKNDAEIMAMSRWLLENRHPKYLLAFTLGINVGLRANELLELKVSQVMRPDGTIRVETDAADGTDVCTVYQSKTKKEREIYLNEACAYALRRYLRTTQLPNQYLFWSREGGHLEVGTLRDTLKEAAKACGIRQNIGTHTLRKTFGYRHYTKYHDVDLLQRIFGHSSPVITMRYIGLDQEVIKKSYHGISLNVYEELGL